MALLDIRQSNWRFKYANDAFAAVSKEATTELVGQGMWDKFDPVGMVCGCATCLQNYASRHFGAASVEVLLQLA